MSVFDRFVHPRLAAIALAGGGWWTIGILAWLVGPSSLRGTAMIVHLFGFATLALAGGIFGVLWWTNYVRGKLRAR
ncbi:hypothetical protein [Halostella pelagica]|uniref:hypothetical protein n=1 Tax=Halostella pelagica TaxID=2583824 RepID=UPI0010820561|nr:hypothetical protein [Halostella pelagica]